MRIGRAPCSGLWGVCISCRGVRKPLIVVKPEIRGMSVSTLIDGASVAINEGRLPSQHPRILRQTPVPEFPA
jgi:hypothetical protein